MDQLEKGVHFLFTSVGRRKTILSPDEESNHRPSDSALRCSNTEPLRLYGKPGFYKNSHQILRSEALCLMATQNFFFVLRLWQDKIIFFSSFFYFLTDLKMYHLFYSVIDQLFHYHTDAAHQFFYKYQKKNYFTASKIATAVKAVIGSFHNINLT